MRRNAGSIALLAVVCVAGGLLGACAADRPGQLVDLADRSWKIRPGFSPSFVKGLPDSAPTKEIQKFPVAPNTLFHAPAGSGITEYTLQTSFNVAHKPRRPFGLLFATIGENWRVYLNGKLVADGYKIEGGELHGRLALRNAVFYVSPGMVREGSNLLTVRLAGALPATPFTPNTALGFYLRDPYLFGPHALVSKRAHEWADVLLPPLFLLMGIYSMVLFAYRMHERFPLYLGLTSFFSATYFFSRLPSVIEWAAEMTGDTSWLMRVEYVSLGLTGACFLMLLERFLFGERKIPLLKKSFVFLWVAIACVQALIPFPYTDAVLLVWQVTAIPVLIALLTTVFAAGFALKELERRRDARRLFPGMAILFIAATWDVLDAAVLFTGMRLGSIGYAAFMFNVALVSATRITETREVTDAALDQLREQEEQVRALFEAAFEALVLHDDGRIVDANPAFYRMFEFSPRELAGCDLSELIVADSPECDFVHPRDRVYSGQGHTRSGRTFRVELRSRRHEHRGRKIIVTAIRDVEAWRALTDELQERHKELELMVRAMLGREDRYRELAAEIERLKSG